MSDDNRLIIKRTFEQNGNTLVNKMKLVEYDDFIQVYITNGKVKETGQLKYAQFRLDNDALQQVKEFLNKC
jgi:hypothetical protein